MVATTESTTPQALPTPILVFTCLSLPLSLIVTIMFLVNLAGATIGATTTATLAYLLLYLVVACTSFGYHVIILAMARRHRVDAHASHSCSSSATSITIAVVFTLLWTSGFIITLVRALRTVHNINSGPWQLPIVVIGVESVVMGCIAVLSIIGRKKLSDPEGLEVLPGTFHVSKNEFLAHPPFTLQAEFSRAVRTLPSLPPHPTHTQLPQILIVTHSFDPRTSRME
jgi:hypothetical protein